MSDSQFRFELYTIMAVFGIVIAGSIFARISEHQDEVNRQSLDNSRHEEVALKVDRIEELLSLHGYYLHEVDQ